MHAVIMGCSRVGAELAANLEQRGFSVAIIDKDPRAFAQRLHPGFHGKTLTGLGFDREVLEEAGIKDAEIFVAVTRGDNSNIVSARIAKEYYGVAQVAALIYDPRRARIYERLGITTVAGVAWMTDQVLARILPTSETVEWTVGSGEVVIVGVPVTPQLIGRPAPEIEIPGKLRIAGIARFGATMIPDGKTILQEGDFLHLSVLRSELAQVDELIKVAVTH
jgi:trk/ktr system potassium uptake protein